MSPLWIASSNSQWPESRKEKSLPSSRLWFQSHALYGLVCHTSATVEIPQRHDYCKSVTHNRDRYWCTKFHMRIRLPIPGLGRDLLAQHQAVYSALSPSCRLLDPTWWESQKREVQLNFSRRQQRCGIHDNGWALKSLSFYLQFRF